ncbi:MAG: DUF3482 domain-containing protein [Balneolales bacterium]
MENQDIPVIVVVGHPNKGKSSIVSTLTNDSSIRISPTPKETTVSEAYTATVNGKELYKIIDTPGFENARRVFKWMKDNETQATERPQTIRRFIREYQGKDLFFEETQILSALMTGSSILYVVDSSIPYTDNYKFEMELLQWTGNRRVAIINPITSSRYSKDWEMVLGQYFNETLYFNPYKADFEACLDVFRKLKDMDKTRAYFIDEAIKGLKQNRVQQISESADVMAGTLIDLISLKVSERISTDSDRKTVDARLMEKYIKKSSDIERQSHEAIKDIYYHDIKHTFEDFFQRDFLSDDSFREFGLNKWDLTKYGALSGGAAGALADLAIGGVSFGIFAGIGALAGGGMGYKAQDVVENVGFFYLKNKMKRQVGPIKRLNLPFVALARGRIFHQHMATLSHANREHAKFDMQIKKVDDLSSSTKNKLQKLCNKVIQYHDSQYKWDYKDPIAKIIEDIFKDDLNKFKLGSKTPEVETI